MSHSSISRAPSGKSTRARPSSHFTRLASEIALSYSHWSSTACEKCHASAYAEAPLTIMISDSGPTRRASRSRRMLCIGTLAGAFLDAVAQAANAPDGRSGAAELMAQSTDVDLQRVRGGVGLARKNCIE